MIYRRFGKTDINMPVLSFGCMRSMYDWNDKPLDSIPQASTDKLGEIVETALRFGINHFETAQGYGSSERQLGAVLPRFKREDYILQTKVVPTRDPGEMVKKVNDSLDRLGVDYVDLLGLHGINDYRSLWDCCRKGGCLHAARKLQVEGKVRHVGFSGHGPLDVIQEAVNHEEDGGFDYINVHWYYIYDVNKPAIEQAADRDMGVYIISPTDKGGMLHTPPPSLTDLCKPFSPILFNDVYCLNQPGVSSISIGASRISDFDEHLKALEYLEPNSALPFISILEKLEDKMQKTTGYKRPEHLWHQLPDREITPGNINLRFIHWLYNIARGWDLTTFARARYNMLGEGSAWVQGNSCSGLDLVPFKEIRQKYPAITDEFLDDMRKAHNLLKE
jgi:uncharacterized protein